jgi:hypothetical protein
MRYVEKSREVMGDNIALHGLLPNNELPKRLRNKIPPNEVWVRKDKWDTPKKRADLKTHEEAEIQLMKKGVPYKMAHSAANQFERNRFR